MEHQSIWLFDSECMLCSRGVRYTLRHEKNATIQFISIQSGEGRALAQRHDLDPDDPTTFLFIEDGIALEKSDAVIALSRHLSGPARLVPLFRWVPRLLRDAAYLLVALNRYVLFGKADACIVPKPCDRPRFVL